MKAIYIGICALLLNVQVNAQSNIEVPMIKVDGSTFSMGHKDYYDTKPIHEVKLQSFEIGKYEITQTQWTAIMGTNPSFTKGDDFPVSQISWYDAIDFCNKLSEAKGLKPYYTIHKNEIDPKNKDESDPLKWTVSFNPNNNGYRLPTEAEWEFAAKGGNKTKKHLFSGDASLDQVGWHRDNSHGKNTKQVGQKKPNELGIYDMSGNVWEWCQDWYGAYPQQDSGKQRVMRGGGIGGNNYFCRVPVRSKLNPASKGRYTGLRLARNL